MTIKRLFPSHPSFASACRRVALSLRLATTVLLMGVALGAAVQAQTAPNEWTWIDGSSTVGTDCYTGYPCGQPGVYGTKGTIASGNIPGSRTDAMSWTDKSGRKWLFGGFGYIAGGGLGDQDDLWQANSAGTAWEWVSGHNAPGYAGTYPATPGSATSTTVPGGREGSATWVDNNGNLWLFGGLGYDGSGTSTGYGYENDLWMYNPTTNQWTWESGSSTVPPYTTDPVLGTTTLGSSSGVYGTKGTPATGNTPGGRLNATAWTDSSGNLWLFGGGYTNNNGISNVDTLFNDLWEFNTSTMQWTWEGGGQTSGNSGVYGTLGAAASGNIPGARYQGGSWTDLSGNFWLFGGYGTDVNGYSASLNDLWEFNPTSDEWTWESGAQSVAGCFSIIFGEYACDQAGSYGTQGTAGGSNNPGGRSSPATWTDSSGNLWLFGGSGADANDNAAWLNDLWEFNPNTPNSTTNTNGEWTWMGGGSTIPTSCTTGNCGQPGVYGSLGTAASANVPGARLQGVTWTDLSGNFWLFGGAGVDENGAVAYLNDMWEYQPAATTTTPQAATPAFTLAIGTYATTQSVSITDSTPNPTIYYTTNGTTPTTSSTLYSGTAITVSSTETIEAIATASGYTQSTVASATYTITPVVKTTPTVTVSPSPAGITTAQALSVTVTVSGSPTATGSVVLTSGSYTSTSATLSSGSATIAVPAGSLATGTDTLTASYTPDSNSSAAYNSATGSNTVTVATAPTASNDWTWVGGSSIDPAGTAGQSGVYGTLGTAAAGNVPGGRSDAMSWTDSSGNRWLFGGIGLDANGKVGELNDLWELNPSTNIWTWVSGSNSVGSFLGTNGEYAGQPGVYGTLGVAAAGNTPGSREGASTWVDSKGNLWLFGGFGWDQTVQFESIEFNDLWEFNPSTNQWTWMGGSNTAETDTGQNGVYGTMGTPAAGNIPGSRYNAASWKDSSGNFWLFGGYGLLSNGDLGDMNDLWEFSPSTDQWTWMGGSPTVSSCMRYSSEDIFCEQTGSYGTLGTAAQGNIPPGRSNASTWTDSTGNFWLFGGNSWDQSQVFAGIIYNDLWKFNPASGEWTWVGGSSVPPNCVTNSADECAKLSVYGTLGTPAAGDTPGSRSSAVTWTDSSGNLWLFGGSGYDSAGTLGELSDFWEFNPSTNEWTWIGGSNIANQNGVYGTLGTPAAGNVPGGRTEAVSWTDLNGGFWLFGGLGFPSAGGQSYLNDLWAYRATTTTLPTAATPTVTVSPLPASFSTTQSTTVTVGVSGGNSNPTPTGSVILSGGGYTSASTTLSGGSATITVPAGSLATGTDTLTATYTPDSSSSSTYNSATGSNTVTVTSATVQVTVGTSPTGLSFTVDNTTYTSPQTLSWTVGTTHTIAATSPQVSTGTQNTFTSWSDAGALSHSVTASSSVTSYTANFSTSYQLTPSASPLAGGGVTPTAATYYPAGTVVNLIATPNSGYNFSSWTGNVASAGSASTTITMNAPQSVTANFTSTSAIATLTPPTLTFTAVTGTTSAAQVATLSNTGTATLNITGITVTGTNPTDFTITTGANACGTTLAVGASCSIYVTFTPASATSFAATLLVADNANTQAPAVVHHAGTEATQAGSTQSLSLVGNGTAPATPAATLTPPTLTFASTTGTTSAPQIATLANTGTATLNISGITITGTNPSDFAITAGANACGTTLAASSSCSIYVTFTPASAASFAATLSVADNASGSPQTTALSGTGTAAAAPAATLTPPTLTFTSTTGTASASQVATLANTGTATLNISGITITGTNPSDFAITTGTNACGTTLAASSSCSIYVTFTPASAATFSATLSVADNASGSPQTSALSGTGTSAVTPTFTVSSTTTPQTIQPGSSAQYTITVAAQNGAFSNPVTLAAIGLPTGATPTFSPASITPGSTSANSTLTIQTPAIAMNTPPRNPRWPLTLPVLALISFLFLPGKRRRRWITLGVLLIASLSALTALSGCGGGFAITKSSQSYTITVTGTSGADVQTTTVQLTVQ